MSQILTVRDLINLWPRRADLVSDISGRVTGLSVTLHRVNKWAENGTIPPKYHQAVLHAAQMRRYPVTADLLIAVHSPKESAA